jgi:hypothetical protein
MAATDARASSGHASVMSKIAGMETPGNPVFENPTKKAEQMPRQ